MFAARIRVLPQQLETQLHRMQPMGLRYVTLDYCIDGDLRVIPVTALLQHIRETISAVEASGLGKVMKQEFEG